MPGGVELATAPDAGAFALAAPGGGSAGAPGGEYAPYLARLRQRVQASLRYPAAARRRGLQGTVAWSASDTASVARRLGRVMGAPRATG